MNKEYLEIKIDNLKDLRSHCNVIMIALTTGLCSIFLATHITFKMSFLAVVGFIIDLYVFLRYQHLNKLIDKYMERLKNEF